MEEKNVTGIFFSESSGSISSNFYLEKLITYTKKIPGVASTWIVDQSLISAKFIKAKIKDYQLTRIIIAGKEPEMVKTLFTKQMVDSEHLPDSVILTDFNEFGQMELMNYVQVRAFITCAFQVFPVIHSLIKRRLR